MRLFSTTTIVIFWFAALAAILVFLAVFGDRSIKVKYYAKFKSPFAGLMITALALSVIGLVDLPSTPYSGYEVSADYKVIRVAPNSPADRAGLQVGDSIIRIGGVPTENLHQVFKQPRTEIDVDQKLTVLRNNWPYELLIRQASLPGKDLFLAWAGNLMAFIMLGLGFAVYWKRSDKVSSLFFLFNLCFALALMTPPYLETFFLRNIVRVNFLLFLTMGFAFFLHLTLVFPKPKPAITETPVELLIYLPAPVMAITYLVLRLLHPKADLLSNLILQDMFALLIVAVLTLAVAAVIHSYWTATRHGMGVVLVGSLLGVVLPVIGFVVGTFAPQLGSPGWEYYSLLAILVPLSFYWVLRKDASSQALPGLRRVA
jgi:PDZ domain-containing protein